MPAPTVQCAKLNQPLPGLDPDSPDGRQARKLSMLFGGDELADRVLAGVSAKAWEMWKGHMLMVMNEFRLDPTSSEANKILAQQMEQFFFGESPEIPNFVPPENER